MKCELSYLQRSCLLQFKIYLVIGRQVMNLLETQEISGNAEPRKLRIAMISPRFEPSYYGFDYSLPLLPGAKKSRMLVGAVTVLAALTPEPHDFVLFDEQIEQIDPEVLRDFDVIAITGMIVQRQRMFDWLDRVADFPAIKVVGGPYVTVNEAPFHDRADAIFIGEAEGTWPQFLDDYAHGRPMLKRYEMDEKPDVRDVPTPRFDLVPADAYVTAPVQFSRGCPFLCEFCDIIVIFGRRPRTKAPSQVLAEIDAAFAAGYGSVMLVDDNFIGDKKAARALLLDLIDWQKARGYPMRVAVEATIDLADQPELLDLMFQANISNVFIGIESPNEESLKEIRKVQNVRGDSLSDKLLRIRQAGIIVDMGMIVGFDNDDPGIFDRQYDFTTANGIAATVVSILSAIPGTPLFKRLSDEGRIRTGDAAVNFEPRNMTPDALKLGHSALMERLYTPDAYFGRVRTDIVRADGANRRKAAMLASQGVTPSAPREWIGAAIMASRLARAMAREGELKAMTREYLRQYRIQKAELGRDAISAPRFVTACLYHWHFHRYTRDIAAGAYAERATYGFALEVPDKQKVPAE
ncbi:MAG: B12-binding domain-containing radical SAM protein [Rhodobacteraceae bacterium]|nr:B12-binding domain-containing radical SAM protein [Paracoccaceae bacterium]